MGNASAQTTYYTLATETSEACSPDQTCVVVPKGWEGPFVVVERGDQCDDASLPTHIVGFEPGYAGECTCDCGPSSADVCITELREGGSPGTCADNDQVLQTCTHALPTGSVACMDAPNCVPSPGSTSAHSYRSCSGELASVLEAVFNNSISLCDANLGNEVACDQGWCADGPSGLCVAAQGEHAECPAAFPILSTGHQGFETSRATCGCECQDPAVCSYQTWYDGPVCAGGSDDDPECSPQGGSLEVVPIDQPGQGCQAVGEPRAPSPPVPTDAITVCCAE